LEFEKERLTKKVNMCSKIFSGIDDLHQQKCQILKEDNLYQKKTIEEEDSIETFSQTEITSPLFEMKKKDAQIKKIELKPIFNFDEDETPNNF
jgi:hypothetical protein